MTTDKQLAVMANDSADVLNALCMEIAHGLLDRVYAAMGDLTASRLAGNGRGTYGDPTAARALRSLDAASVDHADLERCLRRIHESARRAWDIATRYPESRHATAADRADLERLNGTRADGCVSCARLSAANGLPRWEPIDSRRGGPTDVGGRLEAKVLLCRWCTDRVAQWGRWPTPAELEAHHAGKRVPWPTDVERPR